MGKRKEFNDKNVGSARGEVMMFSGVAGVIVLLLILGYIILAKCVNLYG